MNDYKLAIIGFLIACLFGTACQQARPEKKVLVFSKTAGYEHASIPKGIETIMQLGQDNGFSVDTTKDAAVFTEENLSTYAAVVFLNTTGNVLDHRQQADFERYIQSGGGFVGIHAATDTEYDWPWYNRLVGAYFESHPNQPNVRTGTMSVEDKTHISSNFLPDSWERTDEFYNFKSIQKDLIKVLISIDESSYEGGTNGDFHPMSWYHDYDGGRSFYTNFGHTDETFDEELFQKHLLGGIQYAIGENMANDYSLAKSMRVPPDNRFVMTVLDEGLNEPAELDFLPDGRILFTERRGLVKMYDPEKRQTFSIGKLDVYNGQEDGLMGIAVDPNFRENKWLYLYYSPKGDKPVQHLSRFQMRGDSLYMPSEKVVLVVDVQRDECCHSGGSVQFGSDGLLYLSVGDDTNPFETGYAPINELPGRSPWDAQKSSANPNDLRGKVLRIKPTEYGDYEIPDGNLFPKDGSKGRPEIYVMGCRNPYRIHIDAKNHYVYWGDVGPDARIDSSRGPRGYDEVNQARESGFFGWPMFVGNNYAYRDVNFDGQVHKAFFDPAAPINDSPNNTGPRELPPAQPAFIWYPYAASPDFPIVGQGGRNAMAGPVYYRDLFAGTASQFPAYYDKKLFIYDFMRDWIMAVTMNEAGDLQTIEPFLADLKLSSPVDMEFGPDGALYLLEYGTVWFAANADARLIRIDYKEGNRAPIPEMTADKRLGAVPLTVNFSAKGSFDHDKGDEITYRWEFPDGSTATGETASFTFTEAGEFEPKLIVLDQEGEAGERTLSIKAGNEPPEINIQVAGNRTFFWDQQNLDYEIDVKDTEDGDLRAGTLSPEGVAISFSFLDNSKDPTEQAQGHAATAMASVIKQGEEMITTYGCVACHGVFKKVQGPSYKEVSSRYQTKPGVIDYLVGKIINGGSGIWGGNAMPAQAQVPEEDAAKIANYILALAKEETPPPSLPATGSLALTDHKGIGENSTYLLQVSYTDKGANGIEPIPAYAALTLRSPRYNTAELEETGMENVRMRTQRPENFRYALFNHGGTAVMTEIDLSGIQQLGFRYKSQMAGAIMEVRLDAPDGPVVASFSDKTNGGGNFVNIKTDIKATEGIHDLYLVVKAAEPSQVENVNRDPVMGIHWIYFHNK